MSAIMANFMSLSCYFEPAKLVLRFRPGNLLVANKMLQTGLANALAERLQFVFRALGDEFNPTVGQVAHRAGDLVPASRALGGITESHTLHAPRVKNLHSPAIHAEFV